MKEPINRAPIHNGLLLLDKPLGWSSAYASRWVGHLLRSKTGHAGTLDPAATGLLLIGVGEGTKVLRYLSHLNKTYHARVRIGSRTATDDREGEVVERRATTMMSLDALRRLLRSCVGEVEQTPPAYSAVKYRGKPLYYYARRKQAVPRAPRRVRIEAMSLLDVKRDTFSFRVRCSHGTYIRVLARQLGEAMGGVAHLDSLRRVAVEQFALHEAVAPDVLCAGDSSAHDKGLLAVSRAIEHFPKMTLQTAQATRLRHGQTIACEEALSVGQRWRAYDANQVFVGVGRVPEVGQMKAERIFNCGDGGHGGHGDEGRPSERRP